MIALPLLLTAAIVVEDHAALRASASSNAPRQAELFRGDWLEVRGQRADYLQVYDHRHERPGYVRQTQVRAYVVDEKAAPQLAAVIDFLRDTAGAESLGIGYAALFLKAAPAGLSPDATSDLFDAIGNMAERLGRRASRSLPPLESALIAAHLEVAHSYGVHLVSRERDSRGGGGGGSSGQARLCYDGEAFRRVIAVGGTPEQRTRAVLALTAPECVDPTLSAAESQTVLDWQAELLAKVDPSSLPAQLKWQANRLRLRRAAIAASLAWAHTRHGDDLRASASSAEAVRELALVEKSDLVDEDLRPYQETALRVAAARWPAEALPKAPRAALTLQVKPGRPGESCLTLIDGKKPQEPALERCTWGKAWQQSVRVEAHGASLAVSVQTLPGWVELWVFRRFGNGWQVETLAPAPIDPDLGYVEAAGWSPDGKRLLVVREALIEGRVARDFQVLRADTLAVEHHAGSVKQLLNFNRWAAPDWKGRTLALR